MGINIPSLFEKLKKYQFSTNGFYQQVMQLFLRQIQKPMRLSLNLKGIYDDIQHNINYYVLS